MKPTCSNLPIDNHPILKPIASFHPRNVLWAGTSRARLRIGLPVQALMLFLLASLAIAGENSQPSEPKRVSYDLEIVDGVLAIDGKKADATLANVIDALRARYQDANIAMGPGLGKLRISDLKLRAGSLRDELEAVRVASGDKFVIQGPSGIPTIDPTTGQPLKDVATSGLFVLQEAPPTEKTERYVEAFNIEPYLSGLRRGAPQNETANDRAKREQQSIDELTMIVEETIQMMKTEGQAPEPPAFRFHRGANLLVVIGPRESVDVARKIVDALPGMTATPQRSESNAGNADALDAFRRRYGLERTPQDPAATPPESPSRK